jgi:hypothetical protein
VLRSSPDRYDALRVVAALLVVLALATGAGTS